MAWTRSVVLMIVATAFVVVSILVFERRRAREIEHDLRDGADVRGPARRRRGPRE